MGMQPPLPNLPDFTPPQQHRLRTLTFLASAVILVAGVTADYSQGPSGNKPHVFTTVRLLSPAPSVALSRDAVHVIMTIRPTAGRTCARPAVCRHWRRTGLTAPRASRGQAERQRCEAGGASEVTPLRGVHHLTCCGDGNTTSEWTGAGSSRWSRIALC
jgi:hypothetical protein